MFLSLKFLIALAIAFKCFCTIGAEPSLCLDLKKCANRGFHDKVANDGKGGWSDQGPENDFKDFPLKLNDVSGIPFMIIDPSTNAEKSIIALSKKRIETDNAKVEIKPEKYKYLYILHTTCWNKNKPNEEIGNISFKFKENKSKSVKVKSLLDVADWWGAEAIPNGFPAIKNKSDRVVYLSKFPISSKDELEEITFKSNNNCLWIIVAATLSDKNIKISEKQKEWEVKANTEWKAIDTSDMRVQSGSALDMSQLISHKPAGKYSRVVIDKKGKLEFEKYPGKTVRFFSCNLNARSILGYRFKNKKDIKMLADMIRTQGYNLVRIMGLADFLVYRSKIDERFHEDSLDKFDFLVSSLKENGIYMYLDIASFYRAFHKYDPDKMKENQIKNTIFFDKEARQHWLHGFSRLMLHKNKYTGTRLIDDPVVAFILFFNEQGIRLRVGENLPFFVSAWRAWLKKKYKSFENLKKTRKTAKAKSFDDIQMFSISNLDKAPLSLQEDVANFMTDIHDELYEWYLDKARALGYKGIVTHYDWLHKLINQAIRRNVQAVSMHGYHAHPVYRARQSIPQTSSISDSGKYFCEIASARYNGKPFLVTEYGHVFWNKYRYEEGLLFGAYSSLQDFDCISAHCHPVADKVKKFIFSDPKTECIFPFQVGSDPIGRASQVVTGFAFARGDIKTSGHSVNIQIKKSDLLKDGNSIKALPFSMTRLALLSKSGISYSGDDTLAKNNTKIVNIRPDSFAEVKEKKWVAHITEDENSKDIIKSVGKLKKAGFLSKENKTSPQKGEYQSDTGEIYLASQNNFLSVVSPYLEGACIDISKTKDKVELNSIKIKTNVSSSVSVISLEKKKLDESRKLLVVYSTDALNSGMRFVSEKRETLIKLGNLPVLMRVGDLELEIKTKRQFSKAWALGLNGKRNEPLWAEQKKDSIVLKIDTSKLNFGPTPFFEIELK